jgi:hypothetical protein
MSNSFSVAEVAGSVLSIDPIPGYWADPLPEKNGVMQFPHDPSRMRFGLDYFFKSTRIEVCQLRVLRNVAEEIWPPNPALQEDENDFRRNPNHSFFDNHDTIPEYRKEKRKKVEPKDLDLNLYLEACEKIQVSSHIAINIKIGQIYFQMIKVFIRLMEESKNHDERLGGFYYPDDPYNICCLFLVRKLKKLAESTKTTNGSTEIEALRENISKILCFVETISRKNIFWIGAPDITIDLKVGAEESESMLDLVETSDFTKLTITDTTDRTFKLGDYLNLLPAELHLLDDLLIWSKQHVSLVEELRGLQNAYQSLSIGTFEIYLHQLFAGQNDEGNTAMSPINKEAFYRYFEDPFLKKAELEPMAFISEQIDGPILERRTISTSEYREILNKTSTENALILHNTQHYISSGFAAFLKPFYLNTGLDEHNRVKVENIYLQDDSQAKLLEKFFRAQPGGWPTILLNTCDNKGIDVQQIAKLHCRIIGHQHSLIALNNIWGRVYELLHSVGEIGVFKSLPEIAEFATAYIDNIKSYKKNVTTLQDIYKKIKRNIPSSNLDASNLLTYQELAFHKLNIKLSDLEERARSVLSNCEFKLKELDRRVTNVFKMIQDIKVEIPIVIEAIKRINGDLPQRLGSGFSSSSSPLLSLVSTAVLPTIQNVQKGATSSDGRPSSSSPSPVTVKTASLSVESPTLSPSAFVTPTPKTFALSEFLDTAASFIQTLERFPENERLKQCDSFINDYNKYLTKSDQRQTLEEAQKFLIPMCKKVYKNADWVNTLESSITSTLSRRGSGSGAKFFGDLTSIRGKTPSISSSPSNKPT